VREHVGVLPVPALLCIAAGVAIPLLASCHMLGCEPPDGEQAADEPEPRA
jgi:hypothetical protein